MRLQLVIYAILSLQVAVCQLALGQEPRGVAAATNSKNLLNASKAFQQAKFPGAIRLKAPPTTNVTAVKETINTTGYDVVVWKKEGEKIEQIDVKNGGATIKDMWIPWCDSAEQFKDKKMALKIKYKDGAGRVVEKTFAWIWQRQGFVYTSPIEEFSVNAAGIAGISQEGGDRKLYIGMQGDCIGYFLAQ